MAKKEAGAQTHPLFSIVVMRAFEGLYVEISGDYTFRDGRRAYCEFIALDMASTLISDNLKPTLAEIESAEMAEDGRSKKFLPLKFNGVTSWQRHVICLMNDIVFDPIFPNPTPLEEYLGTFFTSRVKITKVIPTKKLLDLFK
ncbi:MAG: hypothetical protein WEC80_00925 [Patescibacteria group bacterium]